MKKVIHVLYFFFLTFLANGFLFSLHGQDGLGKLTSAVGSIADTAKKTWDGAGNMVKGIGQSFGAVGSDYHYSYRIFNNSPIPVFIVEQRLTSIMGPTFGFEIEKQLPLAPNFNTGDSFVKPPRKLYISIWICTNKDKKDSFTYPKNYVDWNKYLADHAAQRAAKGEGLAKYFPDLGTLANVIDEVFKNLTPTSKLKDYSFYEKDIYPWQKNDDNVYYYNIFKKDGSVDVEELGIVTTSTKFSGQFYNSSANDVVLTFTKDDKSYVATLEKDSFNMLQSSNQINSIRPPSGQLGKFEFYKDKPLTQANLFNVLPITTEGLGNMRDVGTKEKPKLVPGGPPMLYTYHVYDSKGAPTVEIQGTGIGNFAQPVSGRVRDINPVDGIFWYQSVAQAQEIAQKEKKQQQQADDYSIVPFDLPENTWINYQTKDYSYQQKVTPGNVVNFNLLRPQLSEKVGWLYIVSFKSDDENKIKKFLDRLSIGKIGQLAVSTDVSNPIDKQNILTNMKANPNGIIDDTQGPDSSGITGVILLADQYKPQGLGLGPFYYVLQPSVLRVDQFVNVIWFDSSFYQKDPSTEALTGLLPSVMQELANNLPQWIRQYKQDKDGVRAAVKLFVQQKGNKGLFEDPNVAVGDRKLTTQGQELLELLMTGPISIENYPIMRKAGTSYMLTKPDNLPV